MNYSRIIRTFSLTVVVLVGMVCAGLILAGCSVPVSAKPDPQVSSASIEVEEAPSQSEESPLVVAFGEVVTYSDGVSISVSPGIEYTPSRSSAGSVDGQASLLFKIVITNNSEESLDPMAFSSATSGGKQASSISDLANEKYGEIGMEPMTTILPGQTIEWFKAYSVTDVSDITLQVSPESFAYDDAIFTTQK